MPFTNALKNLMLDAAGTEAAYASLHTGLPTGGNEVTGGDPAYARKAVTWNAASGGNLDSSNQPEFDVPAATTVSHWGLYDAATSGTLLAYGALSASEAFSGQGTYTLTDLDLDLDDPA